jgi:hypothetical protein
MADQKKPTTPVAPTASAPKITTSTATSIPFDQFTESTLSAVLRAANAQRLGHVPIVIGVIFHPGLGGGGGGYGTQQSCGFASTIKPFFTQCYQQHMLFMFDLWNPTDVQNNWQSPLWMAVYGTAESRALPVRARPRPSRSCSTAPFPFVLDHSSRVAGRRGKPRLYATFFRSL